MQKTVLLFTRPIIPPWDEASKNLAYEIACSCNPESCNFCILSTKGAALPIEKLYANNIILDKIYSSATFDNHEKIQLLLRLFRFQLQADIIHFLFTPRALTSLLIRLRLFFSKTKTIQTVATVADNLFNQPDKLKKIFFADVVVAQSNYTKNKLLKAGIPNVELIYPGIDLKRYQPRHKDMKLAQKLKIRSDDFVILYVGEYVRLKAIDDIVEAVNLLKGQKIARDYKLILACRLKSQADILKKQEIIEKIQKMGYNNKVIFLDTVEDMPSLYNLSDLQIFPVREMSGKFDIPVVLIESLACGKPVIISDIPVLMEFIKNNETGVVIPQANPSALALAIVDLMNNSTKMATLSANGIILVKEKFDIEKNVHAYEKMYNRLLLNSPEQCAPKTI